MRLPNGRGLLSVLPSLVGSLPIECEPPRDANQPGTKAIRVPQASNFAISGEHCFLCDILCVLNNRSELVSANVRFAWLSRSGTGLFIVFNERRDVFIPGTEPFGRSFIVKYTHFIDF